MADPSNGISPSYILHFKDCPNCHETIFAALGATPLPNGIKFQWRCDLCGHEFETLEWLQDHPEAA
jgi:hypothetical protein